MAQRPRRCPERLVRRLTTLRSKSRPPCGDLDQRRATTHPKQQEKHTVAAPRSGPAAVQVRTARAAGNQSNVTRGRTRDLRAIGNLLLQISDPALSTEIQLQAGCYRPELAQRSRLELADTLPRDAEDRTDLLERFRRLAAKPESLHEHPLLAWLQA